MIVVAGTGPLNYLVLVDAIEVLEHLYKRVVVPAAVIDELKHSNAPERVHQWICNPPDWLDLRPDPPFDSGLDFLGPGERAALSLAELLNAEQLLIDDLAGRREAERRLIPVTGTLAVLADCTWPGCSISTVRCIDSEPRISGFPVNWSVLSAAAFLRGRIPQERPPARNAPAHRERRSGDSGPQSTPARPDG